VNDLLARLGYAIVGDDWGSGGTAPSEGRAGRPTGPTAPGPSIADPGASGPALAELRVLVGHELVWRRTVDLSVSSWVVPGAAAGTPFVVVLERPALAGICGGRENIGAALRARAVRSYGPLPRALRDEREVFGRLSAFLAANSAELLGPGGPLEGGRPQ
jgi:hypothetical protein